MIKILFSMLLLSSVVLGVTPLGKPTGCDLSQDGDVSLNIAGYASSEKAEYKAANEVGKNFKELFVGSTISLQDANLVITEIKSNKRVKGLPRTGTLSVELKLKDTKEKINMTYMYEQGHFMTLGKQKNSQEINFSLYIKALLCYSK